MKRIDLAEICNSHVLQKPKRHFQIAKKINVCIVQQPDNRLMYKYWSPRHPCAIFVLDYCWLTELQMIIFVLCMMGIFCTWYAGNHRRGVVVSWSVKLMHLVNNHTCRCGFVNHENSTFWIESFTWIYVYLIKVSVINISEQYLKRH